MPESRFIVLSVVLSRETGEGSEEITWMLVSSNNRPLGRGGLSFATSDACRAAVSTLRQQHDRVVATATPAETNGRWAWQVGLDGTTVAVSTRTYLRHRECDYNLRRFLEALPSAEIAPAVRLIRSGSKR